MRTLDEALISVEKFKAGSLRRTISKIESGLTSADRLIVRQLVSERQLEIDVFGSALFLKKATSPINEVVHAVGIVIALPAILEAEERIEYLSLAAGNTGRPFDLETDRRIAEFKFIDWKGGSETIRQNSLFKDLFELVEYDTPKKKFLYVIGVEFPMKFLTGRRSCQSILSRNLKLWRVFSEKYGTQYRRICEFYAAKKSDVNIVDLTSFIPTLEGLLHS